MAAAASVWSSAKMINQARVAMVVLAVATVMMTWATGAAGQQGAGQRTLDEVIKGHPAEDVLRRVLADGGQVPEGFRPTGMSKKDYLPLIAGNVDFWKSFQNARGEIVDPYEGRERQYSTPAFALSAALLVVESKREDLLEPATRAQSCAIEELINKQTADGHADFYIPMIIHARRLLKEKVARDVLEKWDEQLRGIVPEQIYRDVTAGANWNVVNVCGEYLRRKDGLVAPDQREPQLAYLDKCLELQEKRRFTEYGFYRDPHEPLAYDAFPRLWLEDIVSDGAVEGEWRGRLDRWLTMGALAGLLLISPSGEWPHGGRSAHHQWNEAENAVIAEINAVKWKKAGREDIAGMFKRAAHLCLRSMYRWQRPSGEMWIVKNFEDPARRHGFEGYSFHSQYNLLAMAMLVIAHQRADDSIVERPIPSESDAYVFNFHETFHHVAVAAGGYYVLIDTSADLHYGSTGLQRVHRAGVELSPFTDTPGPHVEYGPLEKKERAAMVLGIEWQGEGGKWHTLGEYGVPPPPRKPDPTQPAPMENVTEKVDVEVKETSADQATFVVRYHTQGEGARPVEEEYMISSDGVEATQRMGGDGKPSARIVFPALVNDGARPTQVVIDGKTVKVIRKGALTRDLTAENKDWLTKPGGSVTWRVLGDVDVKLALTGPPVVTHNGWVQPVAGELPPGTRQVKWKLTLE